MTIEKIDGKLFSSIKVGAWDLNSHIALCPLSRLRATVDNIPSQLMLQYYDERSNAPGTLVITEATPISDRFGSACHQPGIWNVRQLENWYHIVKKVHGNGSFIILQLGGHCKTQPLCQMRVREWSDSGESDTKLAEYEHCYTEAAVNAFKIDFDGIELSAYHYIGECVEFGVDNGNRLDIITRFVKYLKKKLVPAIDGKENRIGLKIGVINKQEKEHLVSELNLSNLNLAYLTITEPRLTNNQVASDASTESNDWLFQKWRGMVIRVGGYLDNIPKLNTDLNANDRTVIGVGKYFASNPNLITLLKSGDKLVPYNRPTFYTNTSVGYNGWLENEHLDRDAVHVGPRPIDNK